MLHPQQIQQQQQQANEQQSSLIGIPEHFDAEYIARNTKVVSFCQILISILGGSIAGVLGFNDLKGFAFYLFVYYTFVCIFVLKEKKSKLSLYFINPNAIWYETLASTLMPFILFWTFFYNIIHHYK
ncbi:transmembrane protein [Tieghemostelium lacteum]|uniref:ER membrane protein complex subunit 6 n=1 Tax=Tieghemostelium lacteum TaxID=361077 RepID=A0A151ZJE9_TIELA|nr:transmembrane protein [Tieghemostelium lacteum]|eukprot:KYQ94122.1 transmembrane protein [Tieghemostelium lacteum]